ncbi:MAG: hypothetical protein ACYDCK_04235 [Thermoplasmatota archaeon]
MHAVMAGAAVRAILPRPPDVTVVVDIPRPVAEVRAWWTDLPADYRAADPREEPHRIVTKRRDAERWEIDTYWRAGPVKNLRVPETFTFRGDGWSVDARIPLGLAQRDEFTLTPTPTGTRVTVEVWVKTRNPLGFVALAAYRAYARKNFPRMWKGAGRLCTRDAPRLP